MLAMVMLTVLASMMHTWLLRLSALLYFETCPHGGKILRTPDPQIPDPKPQTFHPETHDVKRGTGGLKKRSRRLEHQTLRAVSGSFSKVCASMDKLQPGACLDTRWMDNFLALPSPA